MMEFIFVFLDHFSDKLYTLSKGVKRSEIRKILDEG